MSTWTMSRRVGSWWTTFQNPVAAFELKLLAPRASIHGVLVDVLGVGLLLIGRSGVGKSEAALDLVLKGYTEFCEFDLRELNLLEALRSLRLMYYYAWLARRWDDPAFPRAFPWFNTQRCGEQHILTLREQAAAMDEEPLQWQP